MSLAEKILQSKSPFVLFHTQTVTENILKQAIAENKSMDLDVCIDDKGNPYLGHSREYYEKSKESQKESMPIWEAIKLISKSYIPVIVDCKHYDAWLVVEKIVSKIDAKRCLVHSFVSEFQIFDSFQPTSIVPFVPRIFTKDEQFLNRLQLKSTIPITRPSVSK